MFSASVDARPLRIHGSARGVQETKNPPLGVGLSACHTLTVTFRALQKLRQVFDSVGRHTGFEPVTFGATILIQYPFRCFP